MYFPKSQIKSNLYTNGGEYILSTTKQDYKGYYYEVATGQRFTGKTPQDGPNISLLVINKSKLNNPSPTNPLESFPIELIDEESNLNYLNLQNPPPNTRSLPQPNPTFPTDQEVSLGVYTRYFCKKNNELKYMEIDKNTFQLLSTRSNNIAWDLYTPVSTLWYISGDSGSYKANQGLISLIEKNQKWYGFTQWFKEKF
jgi:hypothetical protein